MESQDNTEHRARLRNGKRIVGYSRQSGSTYYYSKDGFWWNGEALDHEIADPFTGIKDKNDRLLYVHDIVRLRYSNPIRRSELFRFIEIGGVIKLRSLQKDYTEELQHLQKVRSLEWLSYAFINTDALFGVNPA